MRGSGQLLWAAGELEEALSLLSLVCGFPVSDGHNLASGSCGISVAKHTGERKGAVREEVPASNRHPPRNTVAVGLARRLEQVPASKRWNRDAGWREKCTHVVPHSKCGNLITETEVQFSPKNTYCSFSSPIKSSEFVIQ